MEEEQVVPVLIQDCGLLRLECRREPVDAIVLVHSRYEQAMREPQLLLEDP